MKLNAHSFPLAPLLSVIAPGMLFPTRTPPLHHALSGFCPLPDATQAVETPLIYAVDDAPHLTELYTTLLESAGYITRTFNDRAQALAALESDEQKPRLLITDYLGLSLPVGRFLQCCRAIHPRLRILMASGFDQLDMPFLPVRPHQFIRKPFTTHEFHHAVESALSH